MGRKSGEKKEDPFRVLCDSLRGKNGVPYRTGVLDENRVEYFRGKDFAAFFREKPQKMAGLVPGNKKVDEQIKELIELMIRRSVVLRCDRMYKKPKPGKKRLVKWPKKLLMYSANDQIWNEESFYSWTYDRPSSPWMWLWSILLLLLVFGACCFQLAPYKVKLAVVYFSAGLMGLMLGVLLLRCVVAALTWMLTGGTVWLFPNLLSDELGIDQAFWPLVEYEKPKDPSGASHWLVRLGVMVSVISLGYALYTVSPNKDRMAEGARKMHDSILDFLNAQPAYQSLSSNETTTGSPGKAPPPSTRSKPRASATSGSQHDEEL